MTVNHLVRGSNPRAGAILKLFISQKNSIQINQTLYLNMTYSLRSLTENELKSWKSQYVTSKKRLWV